MATCGDFGGIAASTGKPCKRAAGWGVPGSTGRCVNHPAPVPLPVPPIEVEDRPILLPAEIAEGAARGEDQTAAILAWIGSVPDGSKLVFRPGTYGIDGGLTLSGRSGLTIDGAGAEFRTAYSTNRKRSHWLWLSSYDITMRNMTLVGPRVGIPLSQSYNPSLVAQFGVGIWGPSSRFLIEDVAVRGVWGDAFYVGGGDSAVQDVVLRRVDGRDTGRHGISATNTVRLLVEYSHFQDHTWSAIDVEPGVNGGKALDIEFSHNTFGNFNHYALAVGGKSAWPNVGRIKFNDNTVRRTKNTGQYAIMINGGSTGSKVRNEFEILRNDIDYPSQFVELRSVADVRIEGNRITGKLAVIGCKAIKLDAVRGAVVRDNSRGQPVCILYEGAPSTDIVTD